ncbi:MAG TPA: MFS transporter [Blastocatellia bacterium]|nr:MFS transporter [Blastocatellia bacterium]
MEQPAPLTESLSAETSAAPSVADRARRRITWRLMPFLLLLYFFAYVDRTNVSIAKLQMQKELGFSESIIGFGAGIFFIGYFLLEIPGTLIVERWSARKWIARIMISWGVVASVMGMIGLPALNFASPERQFYWLRFILGMAEAGFFPGIIVYLSHWFRYADRAKAKAFFMVGIPVATIIGVPLSRWIMETVTWYGLSGWRWVFILEGVPSVILGFVTLFYLTDWPHQAKWLPEDERQWITGEIEREWQEKKAAGEQGGLLAEALAGLRHPKVVLLAAIYFFIVSSYYGLTFFLPSITARMKGTSILTQTIVTMLPYICGFVAMLWSGASSDRTGERRWHTFVPMLIASAGMALSIASGDNIALAVTFFCLAGVGLHAYLPVFWTWPTAYLAQASAAAAVGLINSVGNLGGFAGPYVVGWLKDRTGSFAGGVSYLVISALVAGLLALSLKLPAKKSLQ